MTDSATVTLQSDLPRGELDRLIRRAGEAVPDAAADPVGIHPQPVDAAAERNIDPAIVTTLITSGVALLAPFLAKLAELLFRAEPKAKLTVTTPTGDAAVIVGGLSQDSRDALLREAIKAGAVTVTISVASPQR